MARGGMGENRNLTTGLGGRILGARAGIVQRQNVTFPR